MGSDIWPGTGVAASSGGVTPAEVALARAQALLGPTVNSVMGTDFDTDQWHAAAVVGGGTVAMDPAAKAGVVILSSGAAANGQGNMKVHGFGASGLHVDNPGVTRWYLRSRAAILTAIDANAECTMQLINNTGVPNVAIGVIGSGSTAFFGWRVKTNAGVTTSGTGGVAIDTAWHTFEAYCDGATIFFSVDGANIGSTPVANVGTNPVFMYASALNGVTATNRTFSIDKFYCCMPSN